MPVLPQPGDEVEVPWGPSTVMGRVLAVQGPARRPHLLIEVDLGAADDKPTVSLPAHLVRLHEAA